jgi:CBS domain-containing protein
MRTVSEILKCKPAGFYSVPPDTSVLDAIRQMASHQIGALLVMSSDRLVGMLSERDYLQKVALVGRWSGTTRVSTIMSSPVATVSLDATVFECLDLMSEQRFRHLPVLERGQVQGVISIGDCVKAVIDEQAHQIEDLERFIHG